MKQPVPAEPSACRERAVLGHEPRRGCNGAFAFHPVRRAEPAPATRPAPELDRHAREEQERAGARLGHRRRAAKPDPREAVAVLADILDRDGSQQSATTTRRQALADADHLAALRAIWQGETKNLRTQQYKKIVTAMPQDAPLNGRIGPEIPISPSGRSLDD